MGCFSSKDEDKTPLVSKNSTVDSTKAKAVKNYSAKKQSEISFTIGQILEIVDKTQKDYWMGQVDGQTQFGWFPSVCVVLIDEKEAIFEMEKMRLAEQQKRKANLASEVQSSGERNSVTVNTSGKAIRARALTSHVPDGEKRPAASAGIDANTNNSISLKAGDYVVITDKSRTDWWLGHVEGSNQWGWFPSKCVEIVS